MTEENKKDYVKFQIEELVNFRKDNAMDKLIVDLWPFLITALFAAVGWLWKKVIGMSERMVVMETNMNTCKTNMDEDLQALKEKITTERDQIHKMIDKIQQRKGICAIHLL